MCFGFMADLLIGGMLGESVFGRVYAATWSQGGGAPQPVALKLFQGTMTNDGLRDCERAACLAAGPHPHLVAGLGALADHADGAAGLVMPLLPDDWRVLPDHRTPRAAAATSIPPAYGCRSILRSASRTVSARP